jgi:DNA repair protein RecO (recombination protein O)
VPPRHVSGRVSSHTSEALLLKKSSYGESDLVLALFTERLGRVSALARGAKRSSRRFGGTLEPMHGLSVRLDERASSELLFLVESRISVPRSRLVGDLDRLEAAGRGLSWIRRAAPARSPEPELWRLTVALLDRLDRGVLEAKAELSLFGLRLLVATGWGLELERCVRCGRPCEPGQRAMIAPERGGLVCRQCGGAPRVLEAEQRRKLFLVSIGESDDLGSAGPELGLELCERALSAHAGIERT